MSVIKVYRRAKMEECEPCDDASKRVDVPVPFVIARAAHSCKVLILYRFD